MDSCEVLARELTAHKERLSFDVYQHWMKEASNISLTRDALTALGLPDANPRICLAILFMAIDSENTFDDSPDDVIMRRESERFLASFLSFLTGTRDQDEITKAWRRARRFFTAWSSNDKTRTLEQLMASVVARRARDSQEGNDQSETLEETFHQIRLLGGDVAEQEARRLYAGAWRQVHARDLQQNVTEIAMRAFWDAIIQHTTDGTLDPLFSVLSELEEAMLALISYSPDRLECFKDKFDVAFLKQQAEHGALSLDNIRELVLFIANTLHDWQAPADAGMASEWLRSVKERVESENDMPKFLVTVLIPFIRESIQKVQLMYSRILQTADELRASSS